MKWTVAIIWFVFTALFLVFGTLHLTESGRALSPFQLTQRTADWVGAPNRAQAWLAGNPIDQPLKGFVADFNAYLAEQNQATRTANRRAAWGYFLAAATAFVSMMLELRSAWPCLISLGAVHETSSLTPQAEQPAARDLAQLNSLLDRNSRISDLWREAMAQLRGLSSEMWNVVRFFLTINGVLLGGLFLLAARSGQTTLTKGVLLFLPVLGAVITLVGRRIYWKQREYYCQMLMQRIALEKELGIYSTKVGGIRLAFTWKPDPAHIAMMEKAPVKWLREQQQRKGTMSRIFFRLYDGVVMAYFAIFAVLSVALYYGWLEDSTWRSLTP